MYRGRNDSMTIASPTANASRDDDSPRDLELTAHSEAAQRLVSDFSGQLCWSVGLWLSMPFHHHRDDYVVFVLNFVYVVPYIY